MKKILFCALIIFFPMTLILSCREENNTNLIPEEKINYQNSGLTLNEARKFYLEELVKFNSQNRIKENDFGVPSPIWEDAKEINLSIGKALIVPVIFKDNYFPRLAANKDSKIREFGKNEKKLGISELTNLMMYKTKEGKIVAELSTSIPDDDFFTKKKNEPYSFSGYIWVRDLQGSFLRAFEYKKGKLEGNLIIGEENLTKKGRVKGTKDYPCGQIPVFVEVCVPAQNWCDVHYSHSITAYCSDLGGSTTFSPNDYYYTGGGSYAGDSPVVTYESINFAGSNESPIINVNSELNCLKNNSGNFSYKIAICVDQPTPNSSASMSFSGGVGHTFIQFLKTDNSTGQTISRSVGFYPGGSAGISLIDDVSSVVRNDSQRPYDVSATYTINSSQFTNAVNNAVNWPNINYSLEAYNCTDAALSVLSSAGINISLPLTKFGPFPTGIGTVTFLFIHSPGRLGEQIRAMSNSGSLTVNPNGGTTGTSGTCN